jgi:hypothetical protein
MTFIINQKNLEQQEEDTFVIASNISSLSKQKNIVCANIRVQIT